ncbi:hypothetical protein ACFL14_02595 [Patescibacteria group bacterium]
MFKKFISGFLCLFVVLFLTPVFAQALELRSGANQDYSEDETFSSSAYMAGSSIDFSATVQGDLFLAGSTVNIDKAKILGDIFSVSSDIRIYDTEVEDVRIASGNLNIKNSKISGDLIVGVGVIQADKDTIIEGDVYIGAGNANLAGIVDGNVRIGAEDVIINSQIAGDVRINANSLSIKENADIQGDAVYNYSNTGSEADIDSSAKLASELEQSRVEVGSSDSSFFPSITSFIFSLLMLWIVGLVIVLLMPVCIKKTSEIIEKKPWPTLGWGLLGLIVLPIILFIIFISFLGIPLALMGFAMYFIMIYISKIFVGTYIGIKILKSKDKKHRPIWEMALGVLIICILSYMPIIGPWTKFVVVVFGLGVIIIQSYQSYKDMRNKSLI